MGLIAVVYILLQSIISPIWFHCGVININLRLSLVLDIHTNNSFFALTSFFSAISHVVLVLFFIVGLHVSVFVHFVRMEIIIIIILGPPCS